MHDHTPVSTPVASAPPAPEIEPGATVEVPQPLGVVLYQSAAFALSALLSPYLVIPVGTVGIVASQPVPAGINSRRILILWTSLSVFFSTVIPALYVVTQIWRGKITDVHVMEREQRGGPFLVAIFSSAIGALVLKSVDFYGAEAPAAVWGIGVVLTINGLIMLWISSFWKISMHLAVLSATVLAATVTIPDTSPWQFVWMIPALLWARVVRGRHSVGQGIMGCVVACLVTGVVLYSINLWPRFMQMLHRLGG
ncbi:MAG: hypothetical protein M3347_15490 [Armatimonadota bacterium]|nr:hypothetical protein [Armatimonadota bacterium]